jgi:hypothetical protein
MTDHEPARILPVDRRRIDPLDAGRHDAVAHLDVGAAHHVVETQPAGGPHDDAARA